MMSPTYQYSHHRAAPPVRPSRSLEGLEQVIPPRILSHTRSELFLNKPLPAKPLLLANAPTEYSAMWSDSSDSESTVESVGSPSEPRNSTESYPIFVSSGSDDFSDLVNHHSVSADHDHDPVSLDPIGPSPPRFLLGDSRTDSFHSDLSSSWTTSHSDAQFPRPSHWSQNRPGANHYFREKKWDFFPELATPSALQTNGPSSGGLRPAKTRKKEGRLNLSAKRCRWYSLDRASLGLAHGVRDSIRTYVHRTLSRNSTDHKAKESLRPATAPVDPLHTPWALEPSGMDSDTQLHHSVAEPDSQLRALSVSTFSSASETGLSPHMPHTPTVPRQKQLAVPLSPYQRYGPDIWDASKQSKWRLHKESAPTESTVELTIVNPASSPHSPLKSQFQRNTRDTVRALYDGKSQVMVALGGAKKRITESREDRRREELKSQIKLIGPVNVHNYTSYTPADQWL